MKNDALWTRMLIVLSLLSVIAQIPGLLYLSGPEPIPAYAHRFDHVMYGISQMLSFCLAPVSALSTFVVGLRQWKALRPTQPDVRGRNISRLILLLSGSGMVLAFLVGGLYVRTLSTSYDYSDPDPRATIETRLNYVGEAACVWRMQEGRGSYEGFVHKALASDTNTWGEVYTYRMLSVSADSIRFEGRCVGAITGAVRVTLDKDGHWTNRRYYGEFDY